MHKVEAHTHRLTHIHTHTHTDTHATCTRNGCTAHYIDACIYFMDAQFTISRLTFCVFWFSLFNFAWKCEANEYYSVIRDPQPSNIFIASICVQLFFILSNPTSRVICWKTKMSAHPQKMLGGRGSVFTRMHTSIFAKNISWETMGNTYVAFVQGTPRCLPGRKFVAETLQGPIFIDFGLFWKRF